MFTLVFTDESKQQLKTLKTNNSKKEDFKAITKALEFLKNNPRHRSLNSHEYYTLKGPNDEKIFQSYAQNRRPGAYRIFWYYGSIQKTIIILTIIPHP